VLSPRGIGVWWRAQMHSSSELRSDAFAITLGDRAASIEDVLPGFGERDRLGVVVRHPCGAIGASTLLLAAITAFYDLQRARGGDFFIYPDYFLLHVGGPLGDHSMLDVFPAHKEVVVTDEPEALLEAINDRAITWLLVEDREPAPAHLRRETLASARSRIGGAFAYSPHGRVIDGDLRIAGNDVTESYVRAVLDPDALIASIGARDDPYVEAIARRAAEVPAQLRARLRAERDKLYERGRPVETYRRLTVDQALASLGRDPRAAEVAAPVASAPDQQS
jgi:hypothetical protein